MIGGTDAGSMGGAGARVLAGRLDGGGLESHADTLRLLYDLEFTQLERGPMGMRIDYAASGAGVVYRESYAAATQVLGTLLPGRFAFAVPIRESGSQWWGRERASGWVPTAMSGETIDLRFAPNHSHLVVVLDRARLGQAMDAAGFPDGTRRFLEQGRADRMLAFDGATMVALARELGVLLDDAACGRAGMPACRLDELLLGAAMSALDGGGHAAPAMRASRRLFYRALEVSDAGEGAGAGIHGLCVALGVRPRTLQAAFQQCVGVGPRRFLEMRRLNRARRELERGRAGEASVKSVALPLGFSELGRFSVRYRTLFGESPSRTLARKPREPVPVPSPGSRGIR